MHIFQALRFAGALAFLFLVPGLPIAMLVGVRSDRRWAYLAISPIFSIFGIYVTLYVLNFVGIRPSLFVYGGLLSVLTAVATFRLNQKYKFFRMSDFRTVLAVIPASVVSLIIWSTSYSKYNFVGPNQDAFNHNFWIARIIQVRSVLAADSRIDSPLQSLDSGHGFYPFAWHSAVAVASSLMRVPSPVLSLASIFLIWGIALPFGLGALAREWAPQAKYLGFIAGLLVQFYPLVPGVPMGWGSLTTCVGIALLPTSLFICIIAMKEKTVITALGAMASFIGMIFIHTPEAATLGVLLVCASPLLFKGLKKSSIVWLFGIGLVCMAPILILFRSFIFVDTYPLRLLFGAPHPSWESAIGSFITMGVNVPMTLGVLTLLFIVGVAMSSYRGYGSWLSCGLFGLLMVYLTSGAPSGILVELRIFTAPWYASFERTAWVVVPFFALFAAVPLSALVQKVDKKNIPAGLMSFALIVLLSISIFQQQFQTTVDQLTKGPEVAEVVGKRDRPMLQRLKTQLKDDEIVLTFANDGSSYGFMDEQLPVTAGYSYNRNGKPSNLLSRLYKDIRRICSSPKAQQAIREENIGAIIFGDTLLGWGGENWSRPEIRKLGGIRVTDFGQHLTVAVPDLDSCKDNSTKN